MPLPETPEYKLWVRTPVCHDSPSGMHVPDYDNPVDLKDTMGETFTDSIRCVHCGTLLMSSWV